MFRSSYLESNHCVVVEHPDEDLHYSLNQRKQHEQPLVDSPVDDVDSNTLKREIEHLLREQQRVHVHPPTRGVIDINNYEDDDSDDVDDERSPAPRPADARRSGSGSGSGSPYHYRYPPSSYNAVSAAKPHQRRSPAGSRASPFVDTINSASVSAANATATAAATTAEEEEDGSAYPNNTEEEEYYYNLYVNHVSNNNNSNNNNYHGARRRYSYSPSSYYSPAQSQSQIQGQHPQAHPLGPLGSSQEREQAQSRRASLQLQLHLHPPSPVPSFSGLNTGAASAAAGPRGGRSSRSASPSPHRVQRNWGVEQSQLPPPQQPPQQQQPQLQLQVPNPTTLTPSPQPRPRRSVSLNVSPTSSGYSSRRTSLNVYGSRTPSPLLLTPNLYSSSALPVLPSRAGSSEGHGRREGEEEEEVEEEEMEEEEEEEMGGMRMSVLKSGMMMGMGAMSCSAPNEEASPLRTALLLDTSATAAAARGTGMMMEARRRSRGPAVGSLMRRRKDWKEFKEWEGAEKNGDEEDEEDEGVVDLSSRCGSRRASVQGGMGLGLGLELGEPTYVNRRQSQYVTVDDHKGRKKARSQSRGREKVSRTANEYEDREEDDEGEEEEDEDEEKGERVPRCDFEFGLKEAVGEKMRHFRWGVRARWAAVKLRVRLGAFRARKRVGLA